MEAKHERECLSICDITQLQRGLVVAYLSSATMAVMSSTSEMRNFGIVFPSGKFRKFGLY